MLLALLGFAAGNFTKMKDINKNTLIEALSMLPEYEPPVHVWESVQMQVEEFPPKNMLKQMPVYQPPTRGWESILSNLESSANRAKIVSIRWKQVLAVAAAMALVLFSIWRIGLPKPGDDVQTAMNYSTETVDDQLLVNDWDEDEDAFVQFREICEAKKIICQQPEFVQLQTELEELTGAKEALKAAMGSYGATADLITQIKDIEMERTGILKRMMVMLI